MYNQKWRINPWKLFIGIWFGSMFSLCQIIFNRNIFLGVYFSSITPSVVVIKWSMKLYWNQWDQNKRNQINHFGRMLFKNALFIDNPQFLIASTCKSKSRHSLKAFKWSGLLFYFVLAIADGVTSNHIFSDSICHNAVLQLIWKVITSPKQQKNTQQIWRLRVCKPTERKVCRIFQRQFSNNPNGWIRDQKGSR